MPVVALLVLLISACASTAVTGPLSSGLPSGPLHDPVEEWTRDRLAQEPAPAAATPRTPHLLHAPSYDPEPLPQLRPFSGVELSRIRRVQPYVHDASRQHDVPPDLVNGIIWVESKFMPSARSSKGPRGLMQLMPRTARELARDLGRPCQLLDPEFNIHAGTRYFAQMVRRFDGNLRLALAAYNIGPAVVDRWLRDAEPLPDHSKAYVDNVFTAARAFRTRNP